MSRPLSFLKMHANGDDFVIVDFRGRKDTVDRDMAVQLGDRHRGIGFNQLAVVTDGEDAAAQIRFWNPDGSTLNACGSATRGVASVLMRELGVQSVTLRTPQALLTCVSRGDGLIAVDMGAPGLAWEDIPLVSAQDTLHLPLAGDPAASSMGNPHCTFFVEDAESAPVEVLGRQIEVHPLFPQKTNVHFVQVISRTRIRLRIWERGGGIPLGSGSCCCGAVVNGVRRGLLSPVEDVEVVCDGGSVWVRWDGAGGVLLTGPVAPSFRGVWSPELPVTL